MAVTVGVLALQGGFLEHLSLLRRSAQHIQSSPERGAGKFSFEFVEVRSPDDLARCDALVIPGGESTTIAFIAAQSGLLDPLRDFVKRSRKPTWGTCAGLILLAEEANAAKKGGQELIGGLDVRVRRNHFGRQVESFAADVELPFLPARPDPGPGPLSAAAGAAAPFPGVFIRAPVVERLLVRGAAAAVGGGGGGGSSSVGEVATGGDPEKAEVEVLAVLPGRAARVRGRPVGTSTGAEGGGLNDIVAVRQGNVMGTSFHPELTDDIRMHVWWLEQVTKSLPDI